MKKIITVFVSVMLMCFAIIPSRAVEFNEAVGSIYLMDSATGTVIYEKDSHLYTNISGLNKLMGAALVMEAIKDNRLKLSDTTVVSESARGIGGSIAFLEIGSTYTVEELLKAVITVNANDAMIALAEKTYGSVDAFVQKMNEKAEELGMESSTFTNVTGFEDEKQLSTAKDVAILSAYVLSMDGYTKYSKEYMYNLTHPSGRITEIVNTNRLIKTYELCDGLMTGSNRNQNYSIAATGKKGDMRLIAVVLNAPNSDVRNSTAKSLLEYGFTNFTSKKLYAKDDIIVQDIKVKSANIKFNGVLENQLSAIVEKGMEKQIEKDYAINDNISLPLKKGDVIGEAIARLNGQIIGRVNIVADSDVHKLTVGLSFKNVLGNWIGA